jgi:hypothetical protein
VGGSSSACVDSRLLADRRTAAKHSRHSGSTPAGSSSKGGGGGQPACASRSWTQQPYLQHKLAGGAAAVKV